MNLIKTEDGIKTLCLDDISKENLPLISIITVVFNGEEFLEQTIQSVLNQDYKNIEYIIIDGGSTDGTVEIIKKYEHQIGYWISEPDKGIYDAMNKGIDKATGEIVGIINSDDWYEKNCFTIVASRFSKSNAEMIYGNQNNIYGFKSDKSYLYEGRICKDKLESLRINHPTIFVKKSIYDKYGKFDIDFNISADRDFVIRLLMQGVKIVKINEVLSNFRLDGISNQTNALKIIRKRLSEELNVLSKNRLPKIVKLRVIVIKAFRLYRNFYLCKLLPNKLIVKMKEKNFKRKFH